MMENYKIKVNNPAESKEAQELFFELGYEKRSVARYYPSWISNFHGCNGRDLKYTSEPADSWLIKCKQITLPQLRDLVVLHRNDVNDATHVDNQNTHHVDINGQWYFWSNEKNDDIINYGWNESASHREYDNGVLNPIQPEQEQGLISGADAKLAWANGEKLLIDTGEGFQDLTDNYYLAVFDRDSNKFKRKPRTIKLNIEIPATFGMKDGEKAYRLAPAVPCGYTEFYLDKNDNEWQFGAWRTESEIKQVVAALRGALKNG